MLLINFLQINPRLWFLPSISHQATADESRERCHTQDLCMAKPDDGKTVRVRPGLPIVRRIYPGDRFIPRRHGYNFQAASYHLSTRQLDDSENKREIDYCKQVELLDVTYQREAMRAMMMSQECVPGLSQRRILQTSVELCPRGSNNSATQGRSESETKGKWKCAPRKKRLIKSAEKMLSLSADQSTLSSIIARPIDWSCMDVFVVGCQNGLTIYDSNGTMLDTLLSDIPSVVKWSNDGVKIACTFPSSKELRLYDSQKKKFLWSVPCFCSFHTFVASSCRNCCICWSHDDRLIVTSCSGTLSVLQSSTGKVLQRKHAHFSNIMTLNFSSNFKYLVSTAKDNCVRIHTWPNLTDWYNIEFPTFVKAVAWHPEKSGLLCIGGSKDASLSLWNVNTYAMIDYLPAKFQGCVENLAWNKLSGELLVHWSYAVGRKRHSVFPILANFERVVDAIPLDKDEQLSFLKFNAAHKQLVTCCNDVFSIWNFFGDEKPPGTQCRPLYSTAKVRGDIVRSNWIR
ncbi:Protein cortex [Harpegnathos saltator]|uniref:Protein cortex n=1 Tax=Harpegnathos saltator TaxID=610380 RepID=E2C8P0_HARSA|nr:Protein cortex [Harpegnathos saltator]